MSRNDDELAAILTLIALILVIMVVMVVTYVVVYVATSMIAFVVAVYRYHKYKREAARTYQEIADEVGASYLPDDVLRALYGAGVRLADDGWRNPIDWLAGAPMGVEVADDS